MKKQTIKFSLMMSVMITGIAAPVYAAPPEIPEGKLNALRAQSRDYWIKQKEVERLSDKKIHAQLQSKGLHQNQRSWISSILEPEAEEDETIQIGLGDIELDYTSIQASRISLGMLQDDEQPADDGPKPAAAQRNLADDATNPVAPLIQLQFQNVFVGESNSGEGYSNTFVVQPVIPWKIGDQPVLSRITLPLVATPDLGDPIGREYGVGDVVILNAFTTTIGKGGPWQGMIGPVLTTTIPTASSDFTGSGKYQAGPGFVYLNTATKGLQWGIFGYHQWSFASAGGDNGRPEVSTLFFQPIITVHFEEGWYIALQDILWSIDFNDNDRWSLATGVRIGRVTKFGNQPVNIFVEPFYDLSGNNKGNEWGVKLNITFLFPTG